MPNAAGCTLALILTRPLTTSIPFPLSNFRLFSLASRRSFHLSFAVLFRYRSSASLFSIRTCVRPKFTLQFQTTLLVKQKGKVRRKRPRYGTITLYGRLFQAQLRGQQTPSHFYSENCNGLATLQFCALPFSLAATFGIVVTFFSSAY